MNFHNFAFFSIAAISIYENMNFNFSCQWQWLFYIYFCFFEYIALADRTIEIIIYFEAEKANKIIMDLTAKWFGCPEMILFALQIHNKYTPITLVSPPPHNPYVQNALSNVNCV